MDTAEAFKIVLEIAKGNAANARQQEAIRIVRQRLADGLLVCRSQISFTLLEGIWEPWPT
jgi:DNA-binding LacI/PurR family transcriptional regulator